MLRKITDILFPPKCVLCRSILAKNETDLCHTCRINAPEYTKVKSSISFLAGWTTVWYYSGDVRGSLLRYKFSNKRCYAPAFGRATAMKIQQDLPDDIDLLTWIPVSRLRRFTRGYDQVELLAIQVGRELSLPAMRVLKKTRHTPPQSTLPDAAHRRANVLGAYKVIDPASVAGKRVLLLDDILTTGATASECAKTLLIAGAKDVYFASVAKASDNKK